MMLPIKVAAFAGLALAACGVSAQVDVSGAWVRGTVPGQKATGAFMQLKSAEGGALVGAESPVAGTVEIHEMRMEGNVMRMRSVSRLELPAGQIVELKPGGYHMMLIDLKAPLKKGDTVPIKLRVQGQDGKPSEIEATAEVRELTASGAGHMKQ